MASKQDKYTKSARGQACTVRVPFVCTPSPNNETTVLAHLNGGGMATKHYNIHGAYCCSECHTWLDGGYATDKRLIQSVTMRDFFHLAGVIRTQILMIQNGVLKI